MSATSTSSTTNDEKNIDPSDLIIQTSIVQKDDYTRSSSSSSSSSSCSSNPPPKPEKTIEKDGFSIQFMSDIHLEFRRIEGAPTFDVAAPVLVLLGDIGNPNLLNYRRFLWHQADRFEYVFVIPGNHEFYLQTVDKAYERMQDICAKKPNLYFLERSYVDIRHNVRICGTTLWAKPDKKHYEELEDKMSDYNQISLPGEGEESYLTPKQVDEWHEENVHFIKDQIKAAKTHQRWLVLLTHHAPILDAIPKAKRNTWIQSGYATDLSSLFGPPVIAWFFGHTHIPMDTTIKQTRILSNPLGYKTQQLLEKGYFRPEAVISIDKIVGDKLYKETTTCNVM